MKTIARVLAVAVLFVSVAALAATSLEGAYKFSSRMKDGAADMAGWNGNMTIKGNEMTRNYKSPDGKMDKFYTSTMKPEGDLFVLKHTKAYKPEYVGNEFKNKITLNGKTLTIESPDGKFKEIWTMK
jgi:outer membrane lipoprotein-sorting protein